MILDDFIFLAGNTTRSKAYLQLLVKEECYPSLSIIFVEDKEKTMREEEGWDLQDQSVYFNEKEPIIITLKRKQLNYIIVEEKDINSNTILQILRNLDQQYIIYSGYGGAILKRELFGIQKKFIHVHAGKLPQYRGSTTAYYSIIRERRISATAIFLSEKIDEGNVIVSDDFALPNDGTNIDYVYEPYIRATVLIQAIKKYYECGKKFETVSQTEDNAETYYIIHPVLKHLALMSLGTD